MRTKAKRLKELHEEYEAALRDFGHSIDTRLRALSIINTIIRKHEDCGFEYLDMDVVTEYLTDVDKRYYAGNMSKNHYLLLHRNTKRFLHFVENGNIEHPNPVLGPRTDLTIAFQQIADGFLFSENFHPNTRNDIRWIICKYFAWLDENGHDDLSEVGAHEIQKFMLSCSEHYAPSSMYNIKLYMKKLYRYLYSEKLSEFPYTGLLSYPINRESKIYPALPMSDVRKLLDSIDCDSKRGKRAYAAMILGAELGLRACDVTNLKLGDIDWIRGEIRLTQLKTGLPIVLPLTERVGKALENYILNARPKTAERYVFLRYNKPHTPLRAAVTIGEIYRDCCKTAGINASTSYHTLRRSLATAMVTKGVDINHVAQVLGDKNIDSTKKYIALDTPHLKRCALTFDGIFPVGGGSCV